MVSKAELRSQFAKDWQTHYYVDLFRDRGFIRKECPSCHKHFWTLDPDRVICGDPPCVRYTFIGNPMTRKRFDYHSMWKHFSTYYKKHGHTIIKRYPVVARWRPDLYFTIASIADFQPFVVSGEVEPPANPLVVPQVCLRFSDIPNVGVTGRHLTSFIMTGQHAFNTPEHTVYWKNECLTMNWDYLTSELGIPKEEITAIEGVWAGGGNFGPCVEYMCRGLEITNQVFMQFQEDSTGIRELKTRVIDVGWGHARLVWASQGAPTVYEVVFGPVIERMKKEANLSVDQELQNRYAELSASMNLDEESDLTSMWKTIATDLGTTPDVLRKTMDPLRALYAVADHSRTLTFAIADGAIPSNVGGGYNLRVILRRALAFIRTYQLPFTLQDLAQWHINWLIPFFPELEDEREQITKILDVETLRAEENLQRTSNIVSSLLAKISPKLQEEKKPVELSSAQVLELYESQGVTPELLRTSAASKGVEIVIPANVYNLLTEQHEVKNDEEKTAHKNSNYDLAEQSPTRPLYYEDSHASKFSAKLQKILDNRKIVVLDQTLFYPEGGGQPCDHGVLGNCKVVDVQKQGQVILHHLAEPLPQKYTLGSTISGEIDWPYRFQHMQHHSGTHLVLAAARKILGKHVWQGGSQITQEQARIDISHYEQLTQAQIDQIEREANRYVQQNAPITARFLPRREAEDKYGFRLYQGGVVPGKTVRVVDTEGIEVEACGGTHLNATGEAGLIIINRTKRIQDGIVRIEFSAGESAIQSLQTQRSILDQSAEILRVSPNQIVKTVQRLFDDWRETRKQLDETVDNNLPKEQKIGKYLLFKQVIDSKPINTLLKQADSIVKEKPNAVVVLVSLQPSLRFALGVGADTHLDSLETAQKLAGLLGGGAGPVDKHLSQGGGKGMGRETVEAAIGNLVEHLEK